MKKDIEWLKKEVNELPLRFLGFSMLKQREEFTVSKDDVLELINQLDEPEVLSQEWIDEHNAGSLHSGWVWASDLENLLVPKQEDKGYKSGYLRGLEHERRKHADKIIIEKPTIPQFVADYIEHEKDIGQPLFTHLDGLHKNPNTRKKVSDWYHANTAEYLRAWLDGYTVEKEPKYIVDTDDIEISDGNHYLTNLTLSKDSVELPIVGYKSDAIRFDDINQAEAIASYVGGRVEELEE